MLLLYFTFAVSFKDISPILKVTIMKCYIISQHLSQDINWKQCTPIANNMAKNRAFRNWQQSLLQHYTHTHSQHIQLLTFGIQITTSHPHIDTHVWHSHSQEQHSSKKSSLVCHHTLWVTIHMTHNHDHGNNEKTYELCQYR